MATSGEDKGGGGGGFLPIHTVCTAWRLITLCIDGHIVVDPYLPAPLDNLLPAAAHRNGYTKS